MDGAVPTDTNGSFAAFAVTLGDDGFEEAVRRGRALDLTGAVAVALHR